MIIKDFLNQENDLIVIDGREHLYLEVFRASNLSFSYGFCYEGWIIRKQNEWDLIRWDSGNYLSFLEILEFSHSKVYSSILSKVNEITDNRGVLTDFFPIENIVKLSFKMESRYWSSLSLEFILKNKIYLRELNPLQSHLDSSWLNQTIRHNLRTYISRIK